MNEAPPKPPSSAELQAYAQRHPVDPRALRRSLQEHGRRHVEQLETKNSTIHSLRQDNHRLEARNLELWRELATRAPDPDTAALEKYNENMEKEIVLRRREVEAKESRSASIALAGVGAMGLGLFTMVMAPLVSLAWGFIGVTAVAAVLSAVCLPMEDMPTTPFVVSLLVNVFLLFGLAGGL